MRNYGFDLEVLSINESSTLDNIIKKTVTKTLFVVDTKGDFDRYAHVLVDENTVGVRLGNLGAKINLALEIRKRADQCARGSTCFEFGGSEYFGGYNIAGDFCFSPSFCMSGDGDWLDQTVGHLHGNEYCASYYKLYTNDNEWDMSWRIYTGGAEISWSQCDTGHYAR